jgi:adenylate cyclase
MPSLVVIKGPLRGHSFQIRGETAFVGRSRKNDFQIKDSAISRKHLKLFRIGGKFFAEDLRSTNGTMINGEMIASGEGFEVGENDTIAIGHSEIRLHDIPAARGIHAGPSAVQPAAGDSGQDGHETRERRSRSGKDLELIYKVSELLRQSMSIREFLEKVLNYIMETLPRIDTAAIMLFDDQEGGIGEVISLPKKGGGKTGVHYSRTVVDRVIRYGKAVRMSNTSYEAPDRLSDSMSTLQLGSIMCVPMISSGTMRGVIYVDSFRAPYGFRKEDLLLLSTLSGPIAVAVDKDRLSP